MGNEWTRRLGGLIGQVFRPEQKQIHDELRASCEFLKQFVQDPPVNFEEIQEIYQSHRSNLPEAIQGADLEAFLRLEKELLQEAGFESGAVDLIIEGGVDAHSVSADNPAQVQLSEALIRLQKEVCSAANEVEDTLDLASSRDDKAAINGIRKEVGSGLVGIAYITVDGAAMLGGVVTPDLTPFLSVWEGFHKVWEAADQIQDRRDKWKKIRRRKRMRLGGLGS